MNSIDIEHDLDGDGVSDLVVASEGDDKIRWYSQEVRLGILRTRIMLRGVAVL